MNGISLSAADTCRGPLVLVNAQHPYRGGAPALSSALGAEDILLEKTAAALLAECVRAAGAAGEVVPVSGWRPRAQQQSIWNDTMEKEGEAFTKQFVAKPGCSEHETGLAIDLARAARNIDFIRPHLPYDGACGRFRALAAKYGFIQRYRAEKTAVTGIACEPWHFRYVGAPHAQLIEQNGLCLEEYAAFLREMGPQQCRLAGGRAAQVLYVPCENGHARLPGGCVQVSGDNAGGFIATVWQAGARRCGA